MLLLLLAAAQAAPLIDTLSSELDRAMKVLAQQPEPPHYVGLTVTENVSVNLTAREGTLFREDDVHQRLLDVDMRVGTPQLDSTHPLRGMSSWKAEDRGRTLLVLDDSADYALRSALAREIDERYREAAEGVVMVRANQQVRVDEESPADDFEVRQPATGSVPVADLDVDYDAWEQVLARASARLDADPRVHSSYAGLSGDVQRISFVDTEGARLEHGTTRLRVSLRVSSTGEDGDEIEVYHAVDVHEPDKLPDEDAMVAWADQTVAELLALLEAPRGQPYSGPVILRGRAAGVFFHEVLGHRVEGHRQKRDDEGKTFTEYVGKQILPPFIDVYDDPTLEQLAGEDLNGFYLYDSEGVAAMRADIVDDGLLVGFLMGRSPIPGFEHSNSHGRRQAGYAPVSRMGNLVVEASQTRSEEQLRALLLAEIRAQGVEYGIIVDEIGGGFTSTGRFQPNAFKVHTNQAWKVYVDGRPDELVRGIDLVGTPLVAFGNLVAAGDQPLVFNGFCGAESGMVPVSAVAPSVFFSKLEFQLKEKGTDRPPLLPKPGTDGGAS